MEEMWKAMEEDVVLIQDADPPLTDLHSRD
jgi:hypothetical protein